MKRKALGKGLSSLIPEVPRRVPEPPPPVAVGPSSQGGLRQIDIDLIQPNPKQPRASFDSEALDELSRSMLQEGVLQPVVVRPAPNGRFELVAGERRWRAAQRAGLHRIPALIRDVEDQKLLELALIENLQREQLNPIESATAFQTLIDDLGLTQHEVADRVGKQRSTVTNFLRLLHLPRAIQERIKTGEISVGHAKALVTLIGSPGLADLADRLVREGLSVRQVEALVAQASARGDFGAPRRPAVVDPNVAAAAESLTKTLGTKVRILRRKTGGRLEIYFFDEDELERLYQLLMSSDNKPT